ncbi:MAG TPA: DUF2017 family protein [Acidimicrobiales bacterium]|nr:DUF2017 family protein [Acidimicrobiales bacterium]
MSPRQRRRIRPDARGSFEVRLPPEERALLAHLPRQLDELLATATDPAAPGADDGAEVARPRDRTRAPRAGGADDPEKPGVQDPLRRLFPPAYLRDEAAEAAYVGIVRAELVAHHRETLALLLRTADATRLTGEELEAWLAALNDLRLVIGSSLGVTETMAELDEHDPRYAEWVCYSYLSYLENEVVDALAGVLPPATPGADDEAPEDPWGEPPGGLRWDGTPLPGGP